MAKVKAFHKQFVPGGATTVVVHLDQPIDLEINYIYLSSSSGRIPSKNSLYRTLASLSLSLSDRDWVAPPLTLSIFFL